MASSGYADDATPFNFNEVSEDEQDTTTSLIEREDTFGGVVQDAPASSNTDVKPKMFKFTFKAPLSCMPEETKFKDEVDALTSLTDAEEMKNTYQQSLLSAIMKHEVTKKKYEELKKAVETEERRQRVAQEAQERQDRNRELREAEMTVFFRRVAPPSTCRSVELTT